VTYINLTTLEKTSYKIYFPNKIKILKTFLIPQVDFIDNFFEVIIVKNNGK